MGKGNKHRDRRDRKVMERERQLHAESVYSTLPDITENALIDGAIRHYNDRKSADQPEADRDSDPDAILRWQVNYARHVLLPGYEASFRRRLTNMSIDDAYKTARRAALTQIKLKWPNLANACDEAML